jgi:DNA (cytosine-5)-methyltransferase 1
MAVEEPGDIVESSDFDTFRWHVDDIGYSGAWAVLDAQWFGVPQRRRRVFVVGHSGDWRGPAAVLLEPDRLCGHPPARGEARQDIASTIKACAARSVESDLVAFGGNNTAGPIDVATAVNAGGTGRLDFDSETLIMHALRGEGFDASEDGTGRGVPLIAVSDPNQITSRTNRSQPSIEVSHTLQASANAPIAYAIGSHAACANGEQTNRSHVSGGPVGLNVSEELAYSLRSGRGQAVAVAGPVTATYANTVSRGGYNAGAMDNHAITRHSVRRLTPLECERLQGFPDGYTDIVYRGRPAADGPRYKAIGNSMAVPVIRWILERLEFVDALPSSTPQADRMDEPVAAVLHDRALPAPHVVEAQS